jgi:hypothetical protein
VLQQFWQLGDIRCNPARLIVCRGSQRSGSNTIYFYWSEIGASIIVDAMNKEMTSQTEADEEIAFDVPDALLERAGSAEQKVLHFTQR